jgi:rod shape-determining protein MreD
MKCGRFFRGAAAFLVLVTLHYTLRPLLGWRISPDFLVMAVLLMAVRMRPGAAAVLGFLTGLVADALIPAAFGAGALALAAIGYGASWLKAVFFADNVLLHASFFFLGKWAHDLVYLVAERRLSGMEIVAQALLWSPLAAAMTAVVGVLFLILFRTALEPQAT